MLNFYNPVNVRKPTFFQSFQGGEGGGGGDRNGALG